MKAAVMVVSVVLLVAFLCVILHKFWQYSPYLTVLIPPPVKLNRPTSKLITLHLHAFRFMLYIARLRWRSGLVVER